MTGVDLRRYDRMALDLTGEMIALVTADQFDRPTPCPPWTVADLLRHLVSQNLRFAAAARGDDPDAACPWDGGDLGDHPLAAYQRSADEVTEAFAAPDLDQRRIVLPELSGPVPALVGVGFHLTDYTVHAWDVARSLGVPLDAPAELTAVARDMASKIPDSPEVRGPGGAFARRVTTLDDAAPYNQLLGLVGRDPGWTPTGD